MARQKRIKSDTGIYHVMLRGINSQDIFIEKEDFVYFRRILAELPQRWWAGHLQGYDNCTIYAYCILNNHCHILLREGQLNISELMKMLENRFVYYYNQKYLRHGHLFHRPFRSEPVNDDAYFHRLLRYIHRNPIKAMLCQRPEDYPFSSWAEYLKGRFVEFPVCQTAPVLRRFNYDELVEFVNEDVDDACMDMDSVPQSVSDEEAWGILSRLSDSDSVDDFRQLTADLQLQFIRLAHAHGVSLRQASRLSSLTYYKIQKSIKG